MKDYFEIKISDKNQIHLPNEVCDLLNIHEGEMLAFTRRTSYSFELKNPQKRFVADYDIVCKALLSTNNRILIPKCIRSALKRFDTSVVVIRVIDSEVIIAEKMPVNEDEIKTNVHVYIDNDGIIKISDLMKEIDIDTDARCQKPVFDVLNINLIDDPYMGFGGSRNGRDVNFKIFKRLTVSFLGVPVVANINYYYNENFAFMTSPPEVPLLSKDENDVNGCSKIVRVYKLLNAYFAVKGIPDNLLNIEDESEVVFISSNRHGLSLEKIKKGDLPDCYAENLGGKIERYNISNRNLLERILLQVQAIRHLQANGIEKEVQENLKKELFDSLIGTEYDTDDWKEVINDLLQRKKEVQ